VNDPLQTLEALRASALAEARRELGLAQRELSARTLTWETARAARLSAETKLALLQGQFERACGALELRWTEQGVRAATLDLLGASARERRAEAARASAEQRVREVEARVNEHTAGTKAVGQVLEQRVLADQRRGSQREDDEADDLIRARRA
jgi:hypothetical protein